MQTYKNM